MAAWKVELKTSVRNDLRAFGKEARAILKEAATRLVQNPKDDTRNMKTLRPNPLAQRELRLFGKYRVLFSIDEEKKTVTILVVGEKRGNSLYVQGRRFTTHESSPPE